MDAPLIGAFLEHLEHQRGNSVRTRNARLAAIHSLFTFAALRHPEHAAVISGCWPSRPGGASRAIVSLPEPPRDQALLASPDRATWTAAATTRCCCSPSRPGCGPPSSPDWPCSDVTCAPGRTSAATARAAKTGAPR